MNFPRNCLSHFWHSRCLGPSLDRPVRTRRKHDSFEPPEVKPTAAPRFSPTTSTRTVNGTVLLIEAEGEMRGMFRFCLEKEGYKVSDSDGVGEPLASTDQTEPTAVVLNLDLPELDGLAQIEQLRQKTQAHIIALSHSNDEARKLGALEAGANDYLVRPVSMAELTARLRSAHRRAPVPVFTAGDLTVNFASRTVKVRERIVRLTATEFSLLSLFVRNAGRVLSHAEILTAVWGPRMVKRLEYLRVYLKSLRDKIENNPDAPQLLLTERLIGYRLAVPEG